MRADTGINIALRTYCTRVLGHDDPNASTRDLYYRACRECSTVQEQDILTTLNWMKKHSGSIVSEIFSLIEKQSEAVVAAGSRGGKITQDDVIDIIVTQLYESWVYNLQTREEVNDYFRSRILPVLRTLNLDLSNLQERKVKVNDDDDATSAFYEGAGGKCVRI